MSNPVILTTGTNFEAILGYCLIWITYFTTNITDCQTEIQILRAECAILYENNCILHEVVYFCSISDYNKAGKQEALHPLVSLLDLSKCAPRESEAAPHWKKLWGSIDSFPIK